MSDPGDVLGIFRDAGGLLEGHFLLSSGLHSPRYLQCALVLADPKRAETLCARLAAKLGDVDADVVVGPAMGGIVVAYELARALGTENMFAEREAGRMTFRRGFALEPGQKVVLAEDVVTTGRSLHEVIELVAEAGAEVVAVASLVDRSGGRDTGLPVPLVSLVTLDVPTYDPKSCPLCADDVPLTKPGSRTEPTEGASS